jgi:hypothetical protein
MRVCSRLVVFRTLTRAALALAALAAPAAAQTLPSRPIAFADGRIAIGAEVTATGSLREDAGFYNYTDYDRSALRLVRLGLAVSIRATDRVSVLGEIRTENFDSAIPHALYARVRPWLTRPFAIQAGRIPPVFGAYPRRGYGSAEPLIGYPLAYQYLTTLRANAVPASLGDLVSRRGSGWYLYYPVGSAQGDNGLPLVTALRWDTGVQATWAPERYELSAAVTTGTLSNPRVKDDNGGKQIAARAAVRPVVGLVLGLSAARGAYLAREVTRLLPAGSSAGAFTQQAFGADVEYSRDYWLLRGETMVSRWRLPAVGTLDLADPLSAVSLSVEGRYKLAPAIYAAARVEHLGFSTLPGSARVTASARDVAWDAAVTRIEIGGGYYFQRNLIGKVAYQHNWRDGGRIRSRGFLAGQIAFWF